MIHLVFCFVRCNSWSPDVVRVRALWAQQILEELVECLQQQGIASHRDLELLACRCIHWSLFQFGLCCEWLTPVDVRHLSQGDLDRFLAHSSLSLGDKGRLRAAVEQRGKRCCSLIFEIVFLCLYFLETASEKAEMNHVFWWFVQKSDSILDRVVWLAFCALLLRMVGGSDQWIH